MSTAGLPAQQPEENVPAEAKAALPWKKRYTPGGIAGLVLFTCFLLYMIVPAALWSPIYTSIVLAPFRFDADSYNRALAGTKIKPEEHLFTNDHGDRLHSWFFKKPGADKVVLIHHGNAGNLSTRYGLADVINDMGASLFMYDYRGFGKSEGTAESVQNLLSDGKAAQDFVVKNLGFRPEQIIEYGESIGSGVACEVAATNKCGGLILQSGVGSLPRVGKKNISFLRAFPDFLFPVPQFNNIDKIKDVSVPVLIIAGKKDPTVSFHDSEAIYANAPNKNKELVLLEVSGHNAVIGDDFPVFDKAMRRFLSSPSPAQIAN